MRTYEYILLLKPDLTDDQVQANVDRFRSVVEENGRVFLIDFWGKKKLAYEINKYSKGFYFRFVFTAEPDHIEEIERICRINADVIRFLTVKLADKVDVEKLEEEYGAETSFTLKKPGTDEEKVEAAPEAKAESDKDKEAPKPEPEQPASPGTTPAEEPKAPVEEASQPEVTSPPVEASPPEEAASDEEKKED